MHINNINTKTSKKSLFVLFILAIAVTTFYLVGYYLSGINNFSIIDFFQWVVSFIKLSLMGNPDDKFFIFFIMVILPLIIYISLIWTIIDKFKQYKEFYSEINVKSIDLLTDRIQFNFTKPQYNFACSYSDIENLDINIQTTITHTKSGTYTIFEELELNFTLLNNKLFTINNTPNDPMKLIYGILNYAPNMQKFNYRFSGAGEIEDFKENIEKYIQYGKKQRYGQQTENSNKLLSMIFFGMGLIFLISFADIIKDFAKDAGLFFIFILPLSLLIISAVIDFLLVLNELSKIKINQTKSGILSKISIWHILIIKGIIITILLLTIFQPLFFTNKDIKIFSQSQDLKVLKINQPSEYNYMSKAQIYKLRERYVKDSLFKTENYKPSEEVFGQIVDGKPWWGLIPCGELNYTGDYHERIEGDSKVSVQMNNPNALVGLSMPFLPWALDNNQEFCTNEYSKFIPISLQHSPKNNLIIAKYEITEPFLKYKVNINGKSERTPIQLSGLNALDFGYKYVWAFDSKNIKMFNENNVLDDVKMFRDYVHLGGSCKYEGGCNNISPMQNDLMITITDIPAEIDLKLWKKEPINKYSKADIYYKIIFNISGNFFPLNN